MKYYIPIIVLVFSFNSLFSQTLDIIENNDSIKNKRLKDFKIVSGNFIGVRPTGIKNSNRSFTQKQSKKENSDRKGMVQQGGFVGAGNLKVKKINSNAKRLEIEKNERLKLNDKILLDTIFRAVKINIDQGGYIGVKPKTEG